MRYDALLAETITIHGHGSDAIEAYSARPLQPGPLGGVVVIHHMPGYDRATKEITRRFAEAGFNAVCPNLYSREAPGASPDDAAAIARARGGVPDDRLVGDVAGAASYLRGLPNSASMRLHCDQPPSRCTTRPTSWMTSHPPPQTRSAEALTKLDPGRR